MFQNSVGFISYVHLVKRHLKTFGKLIEGVGRRSDKPSVSQFKANQSDFYYQLSQSVTAGGFVLTWPLPTDLPVFYYTLAKTRQFFALPLI